MSSAWYVQCYAFQDVLRARNKLNSTWGAAKSFVIPRLACLSAKPSVTWFRHPTASGDINSSAAFLPSFFQPLHSSILRFFGIASRSSAILSYSVPQSLHLATSGSLIRLPQHFYHRILQFIHFKLVPTSPSPHSSSHGSISLSPPPSTLSSRFPNISTPPPSSGFLNTRILLPPISSFLTNNHRRSHSLASSPTAYPAFYPRLHQSQPLAAWACHHRLPTTSSAGLRNLRQQANNILPTTEPT